MTNTTIQLKKSGTEEAVPSSLEYGEIAINYADGKIFYKNVNDEIVEFASGAAGDSFATMNVGGTLMVADQPNDVFTFKSGNNITITPDTTNDAITISSTIVKIQNTAPTSPAPGNLWWNSDVGKLLIYYADANSSQWVEASQVSSGGPIVENITAIFNGGGAEITTGIAGDLEISYDALILGVTMLADQTGSIVVDIWKNTYANYPPVSANTITANTSPTINAATKSQDTTLTDWTTFINAGDILRFNVDSCADIERCTLSLKVLRT